MKALPKLLLAFGLAAGVSPAPAQDCPARPVKAIVAVGPGGTGDVVTRVLGEELHRREPLAYNQFLYKRLAYDPARDFQPIINLFYFGIVAPAGTPRPIITRIHAEIARIGSDPAVRKRQLTDRALEPILNTPEEFARFIIEDRANSERVVKEAGLPAPVTENGAVE